MTRKTKKKKPPALRPLSAEEQTAVDGLLKGIETLPQEEAVEVLRSPRAATAFIERLPLHSPSILPLLFSLNKRFPEKEVQKALRKVLFKLKQMGSPVPDFGHEEERGVLSKPLLKEASFARIGPVDGSGTRPIFFALPQAPAGFDVGLGVVGDELGILHFLAGRYSKKRMRDLENHLREETEGTPMVETSLSHVATILEEAYQETKEKGKVPPEYLTIRPVLLERAPLLHHPVIYDHLSEEETHPAALTDSQLEKLFGHPLMGSWLIEPSEVKDLAESILKVRESPIFLSEAQKRDRIRILEEEWIDEIYPAQRRGKLRRRLEEIAYIFLKQEDPEYARLALRAGKSLMEESPSRRNPVLLLLLERSLSLFMEADPAASKGGGREAPPSILLP
jgi:hypothetical protein